MNDGSKAFTLNTTDLLNLGKNALLVGLAAGLAYVGENLSDVDWGASGVLLVPVISVGIDTLVKWMKNNQKENNA
jgi:hypothetical protein